MHICMYINFRMCIYMHTCMPACTYPKFHIWVWCFKLSCTICIFTHIQIQYSSYVPIKFLEFAYVRITYIHTCVCCDFVVISQWAFHVHILQVDVSHVKDLPAFYGNFLFGQYDLFGQSQPTVFYSEDHSKRPPCDDECEISVEFNHCQVIHTCMCVYTKIRVGKWLWQILRFE